MRHLCRDFLTLASASSPGTNMYALSIFMQIVGGFSTIGQTNFDVLGSYQAGSGSMLARGISGSINTGFGTHEVQLPTGSYLVSSADVGRILALRSQQFTRSNSGLFRVTGFDAPNNALVIDYRTATAPPPENFLLWGLFVDEVTASLSWQTGSNGDINYGSFTPNTSSVASASRVILQSPDQSSWQVRMCLESLHDVSGAVPSGFSIAPGYGGADLGDFLPLSSNPGVNQRLYLHGAAFYNTTSSQYRGMTVGLTPSSQVSGSFWTKGQWRISMMVSDVSGTCAIVNHNVNLPVTANVSGSGWCVFGLTEDESEFPGQANLSDPTVNIQRLFVVGSSNPQSNLTWTSQFHLDNNIQVIGWSKLGYPVAGVVSLYSDISNPATGHVRYLTTATDSPWIGETELLDAEILLGTIDVTVSASSTTPLWPIQPRRLGRLPMFMQGRANYTQWAVTGDAGWYHTEDGVFMQWGGPVPTGNPVVSSVSPQSGSNELQQGLDPLGAFLPGSDPPVPPVIPNVLDVDATRFRKTYSYFRQVPVNVGVVKGGSNPAKP